MTDPTAYLRHPRGRGKIYDDAEVHMTAYLSKDSFADDESQLRDCQVVDGSAIIHRARIFGGYIVNSIVGRDVVIAGSPLITNSVIFGKSVSGKPDISCVTLHSHAEIAGKPVIYGRGRGILITDYALVYGDAVLQGQFTVSGKMRIATGTWERAPRYIDLGFVSVTESKLGAMVDCRDRTIDYWFIHGPKFGRRWGWSEQQIAETLLAVKYVSEGDSSN